ncbi:DUF3558 family protein [Amycolatopsis sp. NPDC051128]|uniref:DUF3558 family protein n=1 Tax=Amycolatopsis sp. NPDC051128 TaxID=3155412 RepID=UPI003434EDA8
MRTFAVALVAFVALTACSSGDKPSTTTSSSAAPKPAPTSSKAAAASLDPCALLPADAVAKAISVPDLKAVPGPVQDNTANGGKARSCEYQLNGKAAGALAVTRYEGRQAKPAEMVASIKKAKAGSQDVAGFPDGAVYYIDEQKTATLASAELVAGTPVLVNYTGPAKMTPEMMAPLVKQALAAS